MTLRLPTETPAQAVSLIRHAASLTGKKKIIAFSGGKDSIVTALLCARAGVTDAVCEEAFTLASMRASTRRLATAIGLNVTYLNSLDHEWLKRHPEMLFGDLKQQAKMYHARQQRSIARYAEEHDVGVVFFGRRTQENTVKAALYERDGVLSCFPIRDWRLEQVLGYIEQQRIVLPEIYGTEYGRREGFAPWIGLERRFFPNPFQTLYEMEPGIVVEAARWNSEAAAVLKANGAFAP